MRRSRTSTESELPFAGELLDVAEEFADWRGAAERVLRGFALSLLVPQQHYDRRVSLGQRAPAHLPPQRRTDGRQPTRVRAGAGPAGSAAAAHRRPPAAPRRHHRHRGRPVPRLPSRRARSGGPTSPCADTVEEFRDEHRAVTREGQVRSGDRHEKDDRSRVDDPRSWVLGWANERKIARSDRAPGRAAEPVRPGQCGPTPGCAISATRWRRRRRRWTAWLATARGPNLTGRSRRPGDRRGRGARSG